MWNLCTVHVNTIILHTPEAKGCWVAAVYTTLIYTAGLAEGLIFSWWTKNRSLFSAWWPSPCRTRLTDWLIPVFRFRHIYWHKNCILLRISAWCLIMERRTWFEQVITFCLSFWEKKKEYWCLVLSWLPSCCTILWFLFCSVQISGQPRFWLRLDEHHTVVPHTVDHRAVQSLHYYTG